MSDTTTEILNERGKRYGKFVDHARISKAIRTAMFREVRADKINSLEPDQIEALYMIAHKIARILNGDPNYGDSWRDIAGYATLIADRLEGVER
jgi:hypothetical protein